MYINNISCPRCFSKNLYRFAKNNLGHQKYQCKECVRQFSANSKLGDNRRSYPISVLFVIQEHICIMIIFTILDLNVIPESVIIFILQ